MTSLGMRRSDHGRRDPGAYFGLLQVDTALLLQDIMRSGLLRALPIDPANIIRHCVI